MSLLEVRNVETFYGAIMALRGGLRKDPGPGPAARVVDWISVPYGVATLRGAREVLEAESFDVILADAVLADGDSSELTAWLRQREARVLDGPRISRRFHIFARKNRVLSPAAAGFCDFLVQACLKQDWVRLPEAVSR